MYRSAPLTSTNFLMRILSSSFSFSLSPFPFFASHIPPLHACASQRIQSNSLVRFDRVVKKPSNFSPDYPRTNFHTNYFPLERATKRVSVFGPATVTVPRSYTATGRNNSLSLARKGNLTVRNRRRWVPFLNFESPIFSLSGESKWRSTDTSSCWRKEANEKREILLFFLNSKFHRNFFFLRAFVIISISRVEWFFNVKRKRRKCEIIE